MKKKKIIIVIIILAIFLIGFGIWYLLSSQEPEETNPEPTAPPAVEISTWEDIIMKNRGQNHYYIDYNFQITGPDLNVNGTLTFDINHDEQEQLIDATITKNEEDPLVYHGIYDLYYNDRFYYNLDDRSTYLSVDEKNDIDTIYSLMEKATDVNTETFTISKDEMQNILEQSVIRYLTETKGDDVITVSNDVVFHYTMDEELKLLKTLNAEFTINDNQTMTVSYTFQTGSDTAA